MLNTKGIAVIGSGPAGLMASYELSKRGYRVSLFESKTSIGRKLLIAGSSGLNIGNNYALQDFLAPITSDTPPNYFKRFFETFFTQKWLAFIEDVLKIKTFLGTSNKYFVEEMNAATLVSVWKKLLESMGVQIFPEWKWYEFAKETDGLTLKFQVSGRDVATKKFNACIFALGGASWEPELPDWIEHLAAKGLQIIPFQSSNTGYHCNPWPESLVLEAKGLPIKNCLLKTAKGIKQGDLLITDYGLEGGPIYHVGATGLAHLDFFPHLSKEALLEKLFAIGEKENYSAIRRLKKIKGASEAIMALCFHLLKEEEKQSCELLAAKLKSFPLQLIHPRPLRESISSSGGLSFKNLDENLMSTQYEGVFFAGEMLNWDAPTGGYLVQTCVSQGMYVAQKLDEWLSIR